MMENCLSEGTIQAFLDGELAAHAVENVTHHIALCDNCAILLSEAEDETAFAYSALEQEFNALVPTQRLWTKINSSIEEERRSNSVWQKILAGVSGFGFHLSKPSVAAFASLLFVAGTFSYLWISRPMPNNIEVAGLDDSSGTIKIAQTPVFTPPTPSNPDPRVLPENVGSDDTKNDTGVGAIKADNRKNLENDSANTTDFKSNKNRRPPIDEPKPVVTTLEYIPGEESYTSTIATLKSTVDGGKDLNLRASERVAFEKDMAVINDAINKMKAEVRKNPKNEAAKQLLFASYQNKIDLLNSVSERNDLMASISR
jgi:hypothetical protein